MPDEPAQFVLRFERVTVEFDGYKALDQMSFEVAPGESLVLFGAAGSGKTVLLKTALGLQKPEAGRVFVFGSGSCSASGARWACCFRKAACSIPSPSRRT
jgi:ABC-type transporter Mla maintaining outer membrane lipid asymmetry ATPase subunit MlaF